MPRYEVSYGGHRYEVSSPTELSDDQVQQHVMAQMGSDGGDVQDASPASRFFGGLWDTTGGAVKNLLTTNPLDTLGNMVGAQVGEGKKAYENAKQGRYSEAVGHGAAAMLPLLGPAAAHAGERIGTGDIAGGLGETAGLLLPEAVSHAGPAVGMVGRGLERVGEAGRGKAITPASVTAAVGHPGIAALELAGPPALRGLGRGMQKVGGAMEAGRDALTNKLGGGEPEAPVIDKYMPNRSRVSREVPGSSYKEPPSIEALPQSNVLTGADQYAHGGKPLSVDRPGAAPYYPEIAKSVPEGEAPRLGEKAPTLDSVIQDALDGLKGESSTSSLGDTPSVRSMDRENMPPQQFETVEGESLGDLALKDNNATVLSRIENRPPGTAWNYDTGKAEPPAPFPGEGGGTSYSDWASGMDDIINAAGPEDMPSGRPTGLGASRLTNLWKDWLRSRGPAATEIR